MYTKLRKKLNLIWALSNSVWAFFSSVKLTIFLLIIIAAFSILGTLIPQQESAANFTKGLSPEIFRLFSMLGLFDMYHAFWFRLLILCLTINTIVCSIDRFPATWKRFRTTRSPDRSKPFEYIRPEQTFLSRLNIHDASYRVGQFLERRFPNLQKKDTSDRKTFLGQKGRYSYFGVYLIHLSVIVILVGALIGSFLGFEAYVSIFEGEQVDTITMRNTMTPLKLGFHVRCDKFTVEFYDNGTPKEYRSEISFIVDGKEVEKRYLLVNHPIQFKGITFYQASYGIIPKVRLSVAREGAKEPLARYEIMAGEVRALPENKGYFRIIDSIENLMGIGPGVLVSVRSQKGEEIQFWVFQNKEMVFKELPKPMAQSPKFNAAAFKPYTFHLDNMISGYYTGLQANKDPGVSIVWLGCFLMVLGFIITFFTSHRRIWIRLDNGEQGVKISVAGTSSKNPVGLERELERLTKELKKYITTER